MTKQLYAASEKSVYIEFEFQDIILNNTILAFPIKNIKLDTTTINKFMRYLQEIRNNVVQTVTSNKFKYLSQFP